MNDPSAPPPNYGSAVGSNPPPAYPQPGVVSIEPKPQDPPPTYEPPTTEYNSHAQYGAYQTPQYQAVGGVPQTIIFQQPRFGPEPACTECPNCRAFVTTSTQYTAGALTWLSAGVICLFGCWMGCCLIPFCINDLQDVEHRCPNCGRIVGTHARL